MATALRRVWFHLLCVLSLRSWRQQWGPLLACPSQNWTQISMSPCTWLSSNRLGSTPLDLLQRVNILLVLENPKPGKLQVQSYKCWTEGMDHFPGLLPMMFCCGSGCGWSSFQSGCTADCCHPLGPANPFLWSCFLGGRLVLPTPDATPCLSLVEFDEVCPFLQTISPYCPDPSS